MCNFGVPAGQDSIFECELEVEVLLLGVFEGFVVVNVQGSRCRFLERKCVFERELISIGAAHKLRQE